MKNLVLILAASFAVSVQASTRVNNGMMDSRLIYSCAEENPADPQNPYLAVLRATEEGDLLIVKRKFSDIEYSGLMTPQKHVSCLLPCDIRENAADGVEFSVTTIGNYRSGIFANSSVSINFKCTNDER